MSEPLKGGFGSFTNSSSPFSTNATNTTSQTGGAFSGFGTNTGAASAFGTPGGSLFGNKPAGNLFGGGSNNPPATSNLFGAPAQTNTDASSSSIPSTAAPSLPSGGLNIFGAKPVEQSSGAPLTSLFAKPATPQPPAGGLFTSNIASNNQSSSSSTTQTQPSTAPAIPNLFGNFPKPAEASTSGSAPLSTPGSGGSPFGTNFFKKPDAPVTPAASSSAAASAPPTSTTSSAPSLFSAFGAKKDDSAKEKEKETASAPAPSLGAGLFGQPAANKDSSAAPAGAPAFGLFGAKPSTPAASDKDKPAAEASKPSEKKDGAAPSPSLFGAAASKDSAPASAGPASAVPAAAPSSTAAPNISVPPPSMLRGKTIEEIVNKWSSDLENHVQEFNRFAAEVAVWDRTLIDNGNTIAALVQHLVLAEREQNDIEQSLQHVEQQQKELSETLAHYEKSDLFDGQGGGIRALDVGPADAERDKHYTLAADLTGNLDDLSRSLVQMIDAVNTLTETNEEPSTKTDAPLEQIAQILGSHLESLQWIDGAVREVENKVTDVEKRIREASSPPNTNSIGGGYSSNSSRPRGFGLR